VSAVVLICTIQHTLTIHAHAHKTIVTNQLI